jgi:hypothetical protein
MAGSTVDHFVSPLEELTLLRSRIGETGKNPEHAANMLRMIREIGVRLPECRVDCNAPSMCPFDGTRHVRPTSGIFGSK